MCGIGLSAPCEIIILEDKNYAPITFFILTSPPPLAHTWVPLFWKRWACA